MDGGICFTASLPPLCKLTSILSLGKSHTNGDTLNFGAFSSKGWEVDGWRKGFYYDRAPFERESIRRFKHPDAAFSFSYSHQWTLYSYLSSNSLKGSEKYVEIHGSTSRTDRGHRGLNIRLHNSHKDQIIKAKIQVTQRCSQEDLQRRAALISATADVDQFTVCEIVETTKLLSSILSW